jgi:uncharacterized protein YjcR
MRLTQEQVQNILHYFQDGRTAGDIAELYGCTPLTIQNWKRKLRIAGHVIPNPTTRRKKINISEIIKI